MTGYEERRSREEDGRIITKTFMVARPGVDMSDLVLEEELGLSEDVTKERIEEAQERLHKQARENAWELLQKLTKR